MDFIAHLIRREIVRASFSLVIGRMYSMKGKLQ